jgi:hypothetical protein
MKTTTAETMTWDRLLNGSPESQAAGLLPCETLKTVTEIYSCGSTSEVTLWRERSEGGRWLYRVTAGMTFPFASKRAAVAAFPVLA